MPVITKIVSDTTTRPRTEIRINVKCKSFNFSLLLFGFFNGWNAGSPPSASHFLSSSLFQFLVNPPSQTFPLPRFLTQLKPTSQNHWNSKIQNNRRFSSTLTLTLSRISRPLCFWRVKKKPTNKKTQLTETQIKPQKTPISTQKPNTRRHFPTKEENPIFLFHSPQRYLPFHRGIQHWSHFKETATFKNRAILELRVAPG